MLRFEIQGAKETVRFLTGVSQRAKRNEVPTQMTRDMASAFRKKVKARIPKNEQGQGSKHNTPTPLLSLLNPIKKVAKGHVVGFKRSGEYPDLPETVEYGTKQAYFQPNNPIFSKRIHPKNKPTYFWQNALKEFRSKDLKRILNKGAKRIVGK